jgi:hypothetical protein
VNFEARAATAQIIAWAMPLKNVHSAVNFAGDFLNLAFRATLAGIKISNSRSLRMSTSKISGIILAVGGLILALVALFADSLHLAASAGLPEHSGLGMYQIMVTIAGALMIGVGLSRVVQK